MPSLNAALVMSFILESCEKNSTPLAKLAEGLDTFPYDSHEQNLRKHMGRS